jgi:hypothetical protein
MPVARRRIANEGIMAIRQTRHIPGAMSKGVRRLVTARAQNSKSSLVLFFKKEHSSLLFPFLDPPTGSS